MENSSLENIVTLPTLMESKLEVLKDESSKSSSDQLLPSETDSILNEKNNSPKQNNSSVLSENSDNKYHRTFDEGYEEGVKKGRHDGYDQGYEAGLKEGKSAGQRSVEESNAQLLLDLDRKIERFSKLIDEISFQQSDIATKKQDILLEIIYETVCKILFEKTKDKSYIKDMILDFIKGERAQQHYTLEISNDDYAYLNEETNVIKNLPSNFEIVSSENVLSGYLASSDAGCLDARTEVMLENFRSLLLKHKPTEEK